MDVRDVTVSAAFRLSRHCGSVVDGEYVLQDTLAKAVEAFALDGTIAQPQAWLFLIVHNEAIDFLSRRARQDLFPCRGGP